MKKHYSIIKYHNYTIEGCGNHYELYCSDGMIGSFTTCQQCKDYADMERTQNDNMWNNSILNDNN